MEITQSSNSNYREITINNINQVFANRIKKYTRFFNNNKKIQEVKNIIVNEILGVLGYDVNDINKRYFEVSNDIENIKYITSRDFYIISTGEESTSIAPEENLITDPDELEEINSGYRQLSNKTRSSASADVTSGVMAGRYTFTQSSTYDYDNGKALEVKDNSNTYIVNPEYEFYGYGMLCEYEMWFSKELPAITSNYDSRNKDWV